MRSSCLELPLRGCKGIICGSFAQICIGSTLLRCLPFCTVQQAALAARTSFVVMNA